MIFPTWQLHRGFWREGVRENTLLAFELAVEKGCEMVELDTQLSREGIPHVFHDFSLKRFFHVDQNVNRTSSEDLEGLNIPRLENVLKSSKVPKNLNIEIKSADFFCSKVARKVCQCIELHGKEKKILISSFNPIVLFWCSRYLPQIPRALIVFEPEKLMGYLFTYSVKMARPEFINAHFGLVDDEGTRDRLLSFKKSIMVWTVNDYDKARFYLARGAKSVISDLPPRSK